MNDKLLTELQKQLCEVRERQSNCPEWSLDYAYWEGFCDNLVETIDKLNQDENPFASISNPLENEYIISG